MEDSQQNNFYETLTGLALRGGGYNWNKVPLSDGSPESGFVIARPQAELNREAEKSLRRMTELSGGAEPHVTTQEHAGAAPRQPFSAPARVLPATKGRPLSERLFKPRSDTGPLAGLSTNEFADAALELFDAIDKRRRARDLAAIASPTKTRDKKHKNRDERAPSGPNGPIYQPQEDDRDDGEIEAFGQTKVANDRRSAAFDVLPLEDEQLQSWFGWLTKTIAVPSDARASYWAGLRAFLGRGVGKKTFGELDRHEKKCVRLLVEKIVQAAA